MRGVGRVRKSERRSIKNRVFIYYFLFAKRLLVYIHTQAHQFHVQNQNHQNQRTHTHTPHSHTAALEYIIFTDGKFQFTAPFHQEHHPISSDHLHMDVLATHLPGLSTQFSGNFNMRFREHDILFSISQGEPLFLPLLVQ